MFRVRKLNTTQPPNHPPTANFESITWEEFVKVAKSKSRKIKQNFHTYLRFNDEYFSSGFVQDNNVGILSAFSLRFINHFEPSSEKSKNEFKIDNTRFLSFSGFILSEKKKLLWILYKMLRYLVRILHPQIFSLSSVAGHFW